MTHDRAPLDLWEPIARGPPSVDTEGSISYTARVVRPRSCTVRRSPCGPSCRVCSRSRRRVARRMMTDDDLLPDDQREVTYDDEGAPRDRVRRGLRLRAEGSMAGSLTGPEQARQHLAEILCAGRVELREAQALMAERGHPVGRVDGARRALEVITIRTGPPGSRQAFFWELPRTCPTCMRPYRPDGVHKSTPWGGNRGDIGDYWAGESSPIETVCPPDEIQPAPLPRPPLRDYGPPRCNLCGKASALTPGAPCPFWRADGRRCAGEVVG
jgi:hypothetical protein